MAYQILVVDDEPALRMMVQEILTQAGYAVCLAGSCRGRPGALSLRPG